MKLLVILAALLISVKTPAGPIEVQAIQQSLKTILPDLEIDRVEESTIPGVYTVMIGAEILYVTADGQYLIKGDLIDIPNRLNLSEVKRTVARKELLKNVSAQELISFAPENPKYTIYVFTDITCPYCQKLQSEVTEINNRSIAIKYLAFPREGADSDAARRMQSVWCAEDRQLAFIDSMIGLAIESPVCDDPVTKQFGLGQVLGVNGTPAIFTEKGTYLRGYMPPDELLKVLSQD